MAETITSKSQLKEWWKSRAKPQAVQYYAWMDSYWHKNEKIKIANIDSLQTILEGKADEEQLAYTAKLDASNISIPLWKDKLGVNALESGLQGYLKSTNPKPTVIGKYELVDIDTYENLVPVILVGETEPGTTPITTEEGFYNTVYFDGINFIQKKDEMPKQTYDVATTTTNGLMSSEDKSKVENFQDSDEVSFAVTDKSGNAVILTESNGETSLIQKVQNLVTNLKKVGFDFNSSNEVVLPEFDTEEIESQINEINVKLEDVQILDDVPFAVADKSGNAVVLTDENGETSLIQKKSNIVENLKKVGFYFDSDDNVVIENEGGNADIVDLLDVGFGFADGDGNLIAKMTSKGFETTKIKANEYDLPIQPNNWLYGKTIWSLGDSMAEGGYWQKKIAELTGAIWSDDFKRLTNKGGTKTLDSNLYDLSGFTRAKTLVKLKNEGKKVDVVFVENWNDGGTRAGTFEEEPYFEKQLLISNQVIPATETPATYLRANLSSFLSSAKKIDYQTSAVWTESTSIAPQAHTLMYVKKENASKKSWKIVVTKPTANTTIRITTASGNYTVTVLASDTIEQVYDKILAYDFAGMSDSYVNESDKLQGVLFAYNESTSEVFTVTYNSGITGTTTTINGGFDIFKFVYKSLDISHWNDSTYWVLRDTEYQPEFGTVAGQFGPSKYQIYKGLIEYLLKNFPTSEIVWVSPSIGFFPTDLTAAAQAGSGWSQYFYPSGDIKYSAVITGIESNKRTTADVSEDVAKKYGFRSIKLYEKAGVNVFNAPNYYNGTDIHPKVEGYEKWGEAIVKELYN